MIAVLPVRGGVPPAGTDAALALSSGRALVVGDGVEGAVSALSANEPVARELRVVETSLTDSARLAGQLAALLVDEDVVVVPHAPDGRDLAPHLAITLGRPLVSSAVLVEPGRAVVLREDGALAVELEIDGAFVATLIPGVPHAPSEGGHDVAVERVRVSDDEKAPVAVLSVAVEEASPEGRLLEDSERIVAVGGGASDGETIRLLGGVAAALGAALGATRVVTDTGLLPHDRQLGTTGTMASPRLYMAMGVSGAIQHLAGIGDPEHVVAVNLDPACPMMEIADLAIVADARATTRALASELGLHDG